MSVIKPFLMIILIIFIVFISVGYDLCIQPVDKNTSVVLPTIETMDDLYKSQ